MFGLLFSCKTKTLNREIIMFNKNPTIACSAIKSCPLKIKYDEHIIDCNNIIMVVMVLFAQFLSIAILSRIRELRSYYTF